MKVEIELTEEEIEYIRNYLKKRSIAINIGYDKKEMKDEILFKVILAASRNVSI